MHTPNAIGDAYTTWSRTYDNDRNLTRDLDEAVMRDALASARFGTIVELGCGTGKNTALLSAIGDRVLALDFSAGMIAIAKQKVTAPNVSFASADITAAWPVAHASADLLCCNLVLEHIENLGFIFNEASRVLSSGGIFLVSELHPFRQYKGKKANFTRDSNVTEIPAFIHHISDFTDAAFAHSFTLFRLREPRHAEDNGKPPRLAVFTFVRT